MNMHATFAAALVLAAGLSSSGFAADATAPELSTPNNAASKAVADTVAGEHKPELSRGFAEGVRKAGGSEALAKEGGSTAGATATPARKTRAVRPVAVSARKNEAATTADLNRAQLAH